MKKNCQLWTNSDKIVKVFLFFFTMSQEYSYLTAHRDKSTQKDEDFCPKDQKDDAYFYRSVVYMLLQEVEVEHRGWKYLFEFDGT